MPSELPTSKYLLMGALGVLFWLNAALIIRVLSGYGMLEGSGRIICFALSIPLAFVTIWIFRALARFEWRHMFLAITVATAVAQICDGIALTYAPGLYSNDPAHIGFAGAVILFGAGAGIIAALWATLRWGQE